MPFPLLFFLPWLLLFPPLLAELLEKATYLPEIEGNAILLFIRRINDIFFFLFGLYWLLCVPFLLLFFFLRLPPLFFFLAELLEETTYLPEIEGNTILLVLLWLMFF